MKNLSKLKNLSLFFLLPFLFQISLIGSGCNSTPAPSDPVAPALPNACAPTPTFLNGGAAGTAKVFSPDPLARSGDPLLSPVSVKLDEYLETVQLSHLKGNGVLQGSYIEVINGIKCNYYNRFLKLGIFNSKSLFSID